VIEFQRATAPLEGILARLMAEPRIDDEARRYLRDVHDHGINLTLETKALTEASHAPNEQVKRISARAAILFAPTLVGTNYGMNFDHMPELHWRFGHPFALVLMMLVSVGLFLVFKRRRWI
jgi:magnesium transporter